jgi:heme exporter protein D
MPSTSRGDFAHAGGWALLAWCALVTLVLMVVTVHVLARIR